MILKDDIKIGSVIKQKISNRYSLVIHKGLEDIFHCLIAIDFINTYRNNKGLIFIPSIQDLWLVNSVKEITKEYSIECQCCFSDKNFTPYPVGTKLKILCSDIFFDYKEEVEITDFDRVDFISPYNLISLADDNKHSWRPIYTIHPIDWSFLINPVVYVEDKTEDDELFCNCSLARRNSFINRFDTFSYDHCKTCNKEVKQ